jgi:hypothetical protein
LKRSTQPGWKQQSLKKEEGPSRFGPGFDQAGVLDLFGGR